MTNVRLEHNIVLALKGVCYVDLPKIQRLNVCSSFRPAWLAQEEEEHRLFGRKTNRADYMLVSARRVTGGGDYHTYSVDIVDVGGSVTGTIQTDALGALNQLDITDWNLVLTDGASTGNLLGPLSGNNSIINLVGTDLTATASGLFFDFGDTTTPAYLRLGSIPGDVVFDAVDIFQAEAVCGCVTSPFLEIRVDPAITDNVVFPSMNVVIGTVTGVPGPIAGAGVPGLVFAGFGLLAWCRRKADSF